MVLCLAPDRSESFNCPPILSVQRDPALSCLSSTGQDAAVRPVETAIRCGGDIAKVADPQSPDELVSVGQCVGHS